MTRLWLKFARAAELCYLSHLDTHRAYARLMRRAGLPLAYSQGFNPHPLISLATPLPLGYGSEADYIDLSLAEPMTSEGIAQSLRKTAGGEVFTLRGLRVVPQRTPALASLVKWAEYTIEVGVCPDTLSNAIDAFAARTAVPFVKETKRGSRVVNVKELVWRLARTESGLSAVLSQAEPAVLRPEELIHILAAQEEPWKIRGVTRQELYSAQLVAPLELPLDIEG